MWRRSAKTGCSEIPETGAEGSWGDGSKSKLVSMALGTGAVDTWDLNAHRVQERKVPMPFWARHRERTGHGRLLSGDVNSRKELEKGEKKGFRVQGAE